MSTNYPGGLDSFTTHHDNSNEVILAADVNKIQDAIAAIEVELGLTPKGSSADVAARLATLVATARQVISGTGLAGGGNLTADRTLSVTYGTTSGTSAQGNDSRITGAAQTANNLSDLANATTSRSNLGAVQDTARTSVKTANYTAVAGDLIPVDTTSGGVTVTLPTAPTDKSRITVKHIVRGGTNTVTVSCGGSDVFNVAGGATTLTLTLLAQAVTVAYNASNAVWTVISDDLALSQLDARFDASGAASTVQAASLQKSSNLSDVSSASTARTNLGLGTAATISSTAGGDLSGTLPSPTVAKVNGVAVSGAPSSAGQVLAATGTTAAAWSNAAVVVDGGNATSTFAPVPVGPSYMSTAQIAADPALTGTYARLLATDATSTSASGTLTAWHLSPVDATSGAATRTLPAASSVVAGVETAVKKADTSANTVTVQRAGSDLIFGTGAGSTSKTLTLAGEAVTFVSNGVDRWTIQTSDTPSGVLANTYVQQGSLVFNVLDYGAKLDGTTNDQTAVQAALDAAVATGKPARVIFPKGKASFTSVTLSGPNVDVEGPGTVMGKIVVGTTAHQTMTSAIRNLRFVQSGNTAGTSGIELMSIERFDITGCFFSGMDSAIYVPPFVATTGENQHTCRIRILDNEMWNVNQALKVSLDASSQWLSFADVDFSRNRVYALVNGVDVVSCDGPKIIDNTFFFISYPSQDTTKQCNIKIGKTDWAVIRGNNFFEAGLEAINLTEPKDFVLEGNNIAWCGQRTPSDAIKITIPSGAYASGSIIGNHADDFTNNYVTITGAGNASRVKIGPNSYHLSAATPASYYGGTSVPSTRFRYYGDTTLSSQPDTLFAGAVLGTQSISADSINNQQFESRQSIGALARLQSRAVVRTVTAATDIVSLFSLTGSSGNAYSGLVEVTAQATADVTKHAGYLLFVGTGGSGSGRGITTVASNGLTAGASASDPSFTWTVGSADTLKATPVGSTSGSFTFWIASLGSISIA